MPITGQPEKLMNSTQPQTAGSDAPPSGGTAFKRFLVIFGVLVIVLIITGFTGGLIINALSGTRHLAVGVASGVQVNAIATLTDDNAFPIGITPLKDGTLAVTSLGTDTIYRMAADGKLTSWLTSKDGITAPGAIAAAVDGSVYLLDFSTPKPGTAVGVIKRISADGKVSLFSNIETNTGLSFLSQLAFDQKGNLYVSFTVTGEIWRYLPNGQGSPWLKLAAVNTTAAQPTGVTYDKVNNALIVADAATGTLYRVPIGADGNAGQPLVLYRDAQLSLQGVTFDDSGRLLLLAWLHDDGQLAQLDANGKYILLAQSFRDPSTLLATGGKVYVVNSDIPGLIPLLHAKPPFTVDVVTGIN
jgi:sugar lactone lactonase YvrE